MSQEAQGSSFPKEMEHELQPDVFVPFHPEQVKMSFDKEASVCSS